MEKQEMTSGQDVTSSTENVNDVANAELSQAERDYKKDMFKYKENYKSAQQEAMELKERLKAFELKEEERKGNHQKVIEDLKDELRQTKSELATRDFTFANTTIDSTLKQEALKHGCKDPDLLVRLISKEKKDRVTIDDGFNPDKEDIKGLVESAMKEFDHIGLFGKSTKIADGVPSSPSMNQAPPKTINEMTTAELEGYIKNTFR